MWQAAPLLSAFLIAFASSHSHRIRIVLRTFLASHFGSFASHSHLIRIASASHLGRCTSTLGLQRVSASLAQNAAVSSADEDSPVQNVTPPPTSTWFISTSRWPPVFFAFDARYLLLRSTRI